MAKRGETQPYRMTYTWPSGIKGTKAFPTLEQAAYAAGKQAAVVGPTGDHCATVVVTHRDQPDVQLLALTPPRED